MITFELLVALVALLIVPGPTNALLLATAAAGARRACLLAPIMVLAGYLAAVLLIGVVLGPVVNQHPGVSLALRLMAGGYLLASAYRMWRVGRLNTPAAPSPIALLVTTLLNPKAMIIALVLMPIGWGQAPMSALPMLTALSLCILGISLLWLGLGVTLRYSLARLGAERSLNRLSALILAAFGLSLMVAGLARA